MRILSSNIKVKSGGGESGIKCRMSILGRKGFWFRKGSKFRIIRSEVRVCLVAY